jgi:hypothetical protein
LDEGGGLVLVDGAAVGVFDVVEEVWWGVGCAHEPEQVLEAAGGDDLEDP